MRSFLAAATLCLLPLSAHAELSANALTHNALTHNALTHNALTHNALTHNALTHNALTHNALTGNSSVANGLRQPSINSGVHSSQFQASGGRLLVR
jgi:hypothetical protein